jgi:hypothetical protein
MPVVGVVSRDTSNLLQLQTIGSGFRVSKGVVARPESQNYGGCLVTTGTSRSDVRDEVHARLIRLLYGVLAVSWGLRLFYFLPRLYPRQGTA